ncbi:MAG: DNA gyrase C-terminal beta-propeller domain-containing protein, partial [Mesobacillus sp.]|uniref:DNA gyrase C-terminal beta-propeller domain-containing protein n=1 Tax=Mesobacillus sp. TaxID=2675271 RepID=UPI003C562A47
RTPSEEYRRQGRGGKGIKTCNITEKNGNLVTMKAVTGEEDLMLITTGGVLIRIPVSSISMTGRNTQGVKLINLNKAENEYVATVAKVDKEEEKIDDIELDENGEAIIDPESIGNAENISEQEDEATAPESNDEGTE